MTKSARISLLVIPVALITSNCGRVSYSPETGDADVGLIDSSVDGIDGGNGHPDFSADASSHPPGTVLDPDGITVKRNACPNCRRPILGCSEASRLLVWGDKAQKHLMVSRFDDSGKLAGEAELLGPFTRLGSSAEIAYGPQQYLMAISEGHLIRGLRTTADGKVAEEIEIATSSFSMTAPVVAFHETTGDYLVVWRESSTYGGYSETFAARVTSKGEVRDPALTIPEGGYARDIACRETGCLIVSTSGKTIHSVMVKGSQVAPAAQITASSDDVSSPAVVSGAGGFFVSWATEQEVFGASLDDNGVLQYEVSIANTSEAAAPSVASNSDSFVVAWGDKSIHAVRTDGAKILGDPIVVNAMAEENSDVALCFAGTNYLAAWLNRKTTDGLHNIFAARIVP